MEVGGVSALDAAQFTVAVPGVAAHLHTLAVRAGDFELAALHAAHDGDVLADSNLHEVARVTRSDHDCSPASSATCDAPLGERT